MDILFICGSAQPGKDGVGDYTRQLCGEVIRLGHGVKVLSLCDQQVTSFVTENQMVAETMVMVNRIPASIENKQRLIWLQTILNDFKPDWISLQFVPYSFNLKGLPFWLPSFLNKVKGNHKWHIMFHELWIGMDVNDSYKNKFIGFMQKRIISKILKEIKAVINTQTELYESKLMALGYKAQLLPLIGNIKNIDSNLKLITDDLELRFCIFGSIHFGAPVEKFINELNFVLATASEKRSLKFVFIGHCGIAIEEWKKVLLANKINFEITGFVKEEEISYLLSSCHYGISTTPYILNQKSGSLSAMFDHQLPVLCVARNWSVKGFKHGTYLNLINYENKETINEFINKKFIASNEHSLEFVASKFLNGLN